MRAPVGIAAALAALGFPSSATKTEPISMMNMTIDSSIRGHSRVGPAQPAGTKIRRAMAAKQFGLRHKGRM